MCDKLCPLTYVCVLYLPSRGFAMPTSSGTALHIASYHYQRLIHLPHLRSGRYFTLLCFQPTFFFSSRMGFFSSVRTFPYQLREQFFVLHVVDRFHRNLVVGELKRQVSYSTSSSPRSLVDGGWQLLFGESGN